MSRTAAGGGRRRRRARGRLADMLTALAFLVAVALAAVALQTCATQTLDGPVTVMDGDSLRIGETRARLRGIDAPELDQTCTDAAGAAFACGRRARDHLRGLATGLSCSGFETDRFGRMLVTCTAPGLDVTVNERMVADGWAIAFGGHEAAEAMARANRRGLWAGTFETPRDVRDRQSAVASGLGETIGALIRRLRAMAGLGGHLE